MPPFVNLDDLEHALMWVSGAPYENSAFVSRDTGKVYLYGIDGSLDEDAPDNIEDNPEFVAVPHKNDLDLGRTLVRRFVDEESPDLEAEVRRIFNTRGAYGRFKDLLARHGLLDNWHRYESAETSSALEAWAQSHGIQVHRPSSDA